MSHIRKTKHTDRQVTKQKLELLILEFLTSHEADMAADYKPESEAWRQLLADALAQFIFANLRLV